MVRASGRPTLAAVVAALVVLSGLPMASLAATAAGDAGSPEPLALPPGDAVWPQFGVTAEHNFSYEGPGLGYPAALVKWQQGAVSSGGTSIANFSSRIRLDNASAPPDALGVAFGQGLAVRVVAGNNGTPMWSFPVLGGVFATPVLTDLDGDGKVDVVTRSDTGLLQALAPNITWDGSSYSFPFGNATQVADQELWNRSLVGDVSTNNNASTPIVVDLAGDGLPEVLAPAGDRLFLINGQTGAELTNKTVQGAIVSAPTAFKVSGVWRVAVASYNQTGATPATANYTISVFDSNLNLQWSLTYPATFDPLLTIKAAVNLQYPSPAAGNLDGAGARDDIAFVTPYEDSVARLRVFDNASAAESVNVSLAGMTSAAPSVTDLDGDGRDEIVTFSFQAGRTLSPNTQAFVEVFNGNGTRRWNVTVDEVPGTDIENTLAPPALADFNGDGVLDVVLFLTDGWTEVLSGDNGSRILRTNLLNQVTPNEFSAPAVADLDHDGYLDLVANGGAISYALPNLTVSPEDISVSPPAPEQFQSVTVGVTVHNNGNILAPNVTVRLTDAGVVLNETTITSIIASFSSQVQMQVNFTQGGTRSLCAEVDWNDTIEELNETDNTACTAVNVSSLYGFTFSTPVSQQVVQPGFSYVFILNVDSEALNDNNVTLTHSPLPAGWGASFSPPNVSLAPKGTPGDSNTSFFSVTTSALSTQGEYEIVVEGVSQVDPRSHTNLTFTVVIGGQYGVALFPPATNGTVAAGDQYAYTFTVFNSGNSNDTLDLTNSTPPPGWTALRSRDNVDLGAGLSTTVFLLVFAPANATQGEVAQISLRVTSRGDPSKNDTATTSTAVVIPDIVVTDIQFYRRCGGEATTGALRLVAGESSMIVVGLANAAGNAPLSNVAVNLWVDGALNVVTGRVPASGTGYVYLNTTIPSEGTTSVTAEADPNNVWTEVNELNNDRTEQVSVKGTTPIGPLAIEGWVVSGPSPSAFAGVQVTVPARGANLSTTTDASGHYQVSLSASQYLDGDLVNVTATDGLDIGWASPEVCAYSEDLQVTANVTLGLPSPYDFLMFPPTSSNGTAVPGAPARYAVEVVNRGPENNSVLLSASSAWPTRVLDENNVSITAVLLAPGGTANVTLEVTVPSGAARGDFAVAWLNATAVADTARQRALPFNTTAGTARLLQIGGPATLDIWSGTGENGYLNITLGNQGNGDENITLSYTDDAASGAIIEFTPPTVALGPGGSATVALRITVGSATTGVYPINITATSADDASAFATHSLELNVTALVHDFSLNGAPSVIVKPGQSRYTNLTITNRGTVADTYTVSFTPPGAPFQVETQDLFGLPQTEFSVGVGASAVVQISIYSPREVDREFFDVDFQVASAGGAATQTFTLRGSIGKIYDLAALDLQLSDTPQVETDVQVTAVVRNVGQNPTPDTVTVVFKVEGQKFGEVTVDPLDVGGQKTVSFTWRPRVQGTASLAVEVNPVSAGSDIYESSFANNVVTRDVQVEPQKAPEVLTQPATIMAMGIIVAILAVAAFAMRGRREGTEEPASEKTDREAEEIQERRVGKGRGGGMNKL